MTKVISDPQVDVAGYMVFKLGAAGVISGLAYGAAFGGSESLSTWVTYSLAVAVTGAFLGSLTWVGKVKQQAERPDLPDMTPPGKMPEPALDRRAPAAEPVRARVSAFRAAGRPAR
jgi:hypothetical protein